MAFPWTPEASAMHERLFALKYSAQQIADRMQAAGFNVSRNAIIGKSHRKKLSNGRLPGFSKREREDRGMPTKRRPGTKPKGYVCDAPALPERGERSGLLIDLDADQCRYPVAGGKRKGEPFLFCTANKMPGSAYCARHHALSYVGSHYARYQ